MGSSFMSGTGGNSWRIFSKIRSFFSAIDNVNNGWEYEAIHQISAFISTDDWERAPYLQSPRHPTRRHCPHRVDVSTCQPRKGRAQITTQQARDEETSNLQTTRMTWTWRTIRDANLRKSAANQLLMQPGSKCGSCYHKWLLFQKRLREASIPGTYMGKRFYEVSRIHEIKIVIVWLESSRRLAWKALLSGSIAWFLWFNGSYIHNLCIITQLRYYTICALYCINFSVLCIKMYKTYPFWPCQRSKPGATGGLNSREDPS